MPKDTIDWIYLPPDCEPISLWSCLHDGDLIEIKSNWLTRTLDLVIDVFHIRDYHRMPEDTRFLLHFKTITSVRATRVFDWPGEFVAPPGITREDHSRLVQEYRAKARTQSVNWDQLEKDLPGDPIDIQYADIGLSEDGVALRLSGNSQNDEWTEMFVRASELEICTTDGKVFDLESFIQLGEDYWDAWSKRSPRRIST